MELYNLSVAGECLPDKMEYVSNLAFYAQQMDKMELGNAIVTGECLSGKMELGSLSVAGNFTR